MERVERRLAAQESRSTIRMTSAKVCSAPPSARGSSIA
jgi:hypothetical protein